MLLPLLPMAKEGCCVVDVPKFSWEGKRDPNAAAWHHCLPHHTQASPMTWHTRDMAWPDHLQ